MHKESRRSFLLLLVLSISLHLVIVFAILVMQFKDTIKDFYRPVPQQSHNAQVVFQQPSNVKMAQGNQPEQPTQQSDTQKKILPAPFFPLIEQEKPEPASDKKPMIMTSGEAASAFAPSEATRNKQAPVEKPRVEPKIQPEPEKTPAPEVAAQEEQEKPQAQHEELPKVVPSGKHTARDFTTTINSPADLPRHAHIMGKPLDLKKLFPTQPQVQPAAQTSSATHGPKKITLAQIANGFINREPTEHVGTGLSTNSNHVATVIGAPAGAATEEQLRYERYAVKLMHCINTSFKILFPEFRFVHQPSTRELVFAFVMDVNIKGDITALTIKQGTGNHQFDEFMVKTLYHAAKSFPPLPSYFKANVCSFPIQCIMPSGVA